MKHGREASISYRRANYYGDYDVNVQQPIRFEVYSSTNVLDRQALSVNQIRLMPIKPLERSVEEMELN